MVKRYRPNKLVYTFATPEGVLANKKWIQEEIEDNRKFFSVEIINLLKDSDAA